MTTDREQVLGESDVEQPESDFRLRSVAIAAFAPATLFGLAEGAMLPAIAPSAFDRGATAAIVALIGALLGIGSIVTNIPAGILATRVGERNAMLVAAAVTILGLSLCMVDLGRGTGSLVAYGMGVLLIGAASAVYGLARQSYLTEMVPVAMRARALSTLGGTMRIGVFAGPFLGAGATLLWGLSGAYCIGIAAIIAAGGIVYRVPDLELSEEHRVAASQVRTVGVLKRHWLMFLTLGTGIMLLSAIRQARQIVIPLWAHHLGLSPATSSLIYGAAGAVDALTFYPAGKVMDTHGRRSVAVPCVIVLGGAFVLMPFTHDMLTLTLVAMLMGFGNGIGSGIVMTLGADTSPAIGRLTFLGIWREVSDVGTSIGPVVLAAITALAGLATGIVATGGVGFAAGLVLWVWIPRYSAGREPAVNPSRA
ncbi:MAG TPA: MFS transporter [Solirubrobacteraceae bacterium]|nr:MFS transporter [Solirubrobacteraceae bacterium]